VDLLVACPGRLTDHIQTGHARLDAVEITVLDEADHLADLGFLPAVRRLLDQTPRSGQRMLFSATLDAEVEVLVRRYLTDPVTHSVDPPRSPVGPAAHHVLQVSHANRLPVLVDLAAAPGRTLVFTRTRRGAKTLTRRLVAAGVPAVELHSDLAQSARSRNLRAFTEGSATTLVATDIAARGIHVDGIALVIHADPPVEHKAYLHRSGRTARAGATGTVVTLATDDQVGSVHALTRKAGVAPTTTRLQPGHPLLSRLAPGQRRFVAPPVASPAGTPAASGPAARGGSRRSPTTRTRGPEADRRSRRSRPAPLATVATSPRRLGQPAGSLAAPSTGGGGMPPDRRPAASRWRGGRAGRRATEGRGRSGS
jgi:superfamily II DNA/RNA helicase